VKTVHVAVGVATIALNGGAAVFGAWCWWQARTSAWFWRTFRTGQAVLVLQAAVGGVLVLMGHKPSSLHLIYGLVPLGVSFVGEQLRVASAEAVLDARGFKSASEVGERPADEQRAVVRAILQREVGVMTIAAIVIVVLLARAAGTG
jgi:hypothetical protein